MKLEGSPLAPQESVIKLFLDLLLRGMKLSGDISITSTSAAAFRSEIGSLI
jgi:hypothetical protein